MITPQEAPIPRTRTRGGQPLLAMTDVTHVRLKRKGMGGDTLATGWAFSGWDPLSPSQLGEPSGGERSYLKGADAPHMKSLYPPCLTEGQARGGRLLFADGQGECCKKLFSREESRFAGMTLRVGKSGGGKCAGGKDA